MVEPVIDDSLVLWLNGACGKNSPATRRWVDLSGKGNHGELQNFGFGEGSGWTGEGLEFDGVDDYVIIKPGLEIMTLEMWPSPHLIDSEKRYPSLFGCGAQSTTDGFGF